MKYQLEWTKAIDHVMVPVQYTRTLDLIPLESFCHLYDNNGVQLNCCIALSILPNPSHSVGISNKYFKWKQDNLENRILQ